MVKPRSLNSKRKQRKRQKELKRKEYSPKPAHWTYQSSVLDLQPSLTLALQDDQEIHSGDNEILVASSTIDTVYDSTAHLVEESVNSTAHLVEESMNSTALCFNTFCV